MRTHVRLQGQFLYTHKDKKQLVCLNLNGDEFPASTFDVHQQEKNTT